MTVNGKRGYVVELGGATRLLRFDMNALCALEEALGLSITDFDPGKAGFRGQRALLWAGLLHEDEQFAKGYPARLTVAQVGEWMTPLMLEPENYSKALTAAANAFAAAFPEPKSEDDSKNVERADGTGKNSLTTLPELESELAISGH